MKKIINFLVAFLLMLSIFSVFMLPDVCKAEEIVFSEHVIDSGFDSTGSVLGSDVDEDGDTDVLVAAAYNDEICWWENDGGESFTKHIVDSSFDGAWHINTCDLDSDGDIDILAAAKLDNSIVWYENDGSESFSKHIIDDNLTSARSVYSSDLDSDGDIDVVAVGYWNDEICWYENDGSESFSKHIIDDSFVGPYYAYPSDLDSDGDIDVVAAAYYDGEVAWYENDGSEVFTKKMIDNSFNGANTVYTSDFDGDGDIDVLGSAYDDDEVAWWENDGSESFTKHIIDNSIDGIWDLTLSDIDGDGFEDVLGAAWNDDEISFWLNDGSGVFSKNIITNSFDGACSIYASDIDSDSDIDVLAASYFTGNINWWENGNDSSEDDDSDDEDDTGEEDQDDDGDGYTEAEGDCDDSDPNVNPGVSEILNNGKDDDCDPSTPDNPSDTEFDPPNWVENLMRVTGEKEEWKGDHWYVDLSFSDYYLGSINGDVPVNVNLGDNFGGNYLTDGLFASSVEVFIYPENPEENKAVFHSGDNTLFEFNVLGNSAEINAGLGMEFNNDLSIDHILLDVNGNLKINLPGINYYVDFLKVGYKAQPYFQARVGSEIYFNSPADWTIDEMGVPSNVYQDCLVYFGLGPGIEIAGGVGFVAVESDCGGLVKWYIRPSSSGVSFDRMDAEVYLSIHLYALWVIDIYLVDESWTFTYPSDSESLIVGSEAGTGSNSMGFIPREYDEPIWTNNATNELVKDVFPAATPNIAGEEKNKILVWAYDNQEKEQIDGVEIKYSLWDGDKWGQPGLVTNDNYFQVDPVVTRLDNGDAVCVFNYAPVDIETPVDLLNNATIGYSIFDNNTKEWSSVKKLSNTSQTLDQTPVITSDGNNAISLWVSDEDGAIGTHNDRVTYASFYNNGVWTGPVEIASGNIVSNPSFDYKNGEGSYVYIKDENANLSDKDDNELFLSKFDSTGVISTTQITDDILQDASPFVKYNNDVPEIIWLKRGQLSDELLYQKGVNSEPETVIVDNISNPSFDYTKNKEPIIFWKNSGKNELYYTTKNKEWETYTYYNTSNIIATPDFHYDNSGITTIYIDKKTDSRFNNCSMISVTPPTQPEIQGLTKGVKNTSLTYSTSSTSLNDNNLYFKWNWGDNKTSDWMGVYDNKETCNAAHSWLESGNYTIKVKAKDKQGAQSKWSEGINVYITNEQNTSDDINETTDDSVNNSENNSNISDGKKTDDSEKKKNTPSFTTLILITSVVLFIFFRKRKKH